jgi:hypothetical protein
MHSTTSFYSGPGLAQWANYIYEVRIDKFYLLACVQLNTGYNFQVHSVAANKKKDGVRT